MGRPNEAALMLERGRLLLVSEVFEAEFFGIRRLEEQEPELFNRYRSSADALRAIERADLAPESSLAPTDRAAHARRVRGEFAEVLERMRMIPGFGTLLQAPTIADVTGAATEYPLIYLAAAESGGVAIVVEPTTAREPKVIWLDDLSAVAVHEQVIATSGAYQRRTEDPESWKRRIDSLTNWLWVSAIGPILGEVDGCERLTLVPTGVLGWLPFHAAWTGTAAGTRTYALDRSAITYAPSARMVTSALRRKLAKRDGGILGVYSSQLPTAQAEVNDVIRWCKDIKVFEARSNERGTILEQLPKWPTLHFACHSQADAERPLDGGLILDEGGRITLRDLLSGEELTSELVVLSACETGISGDVLPDEALGLPTAFIQAGALGVISSMWSVPDTGSFLVAARLYEFWRKDGLAPWDALRQAQRWVRDSTNDEIARHFPSAGLNGTKLRENERAFWGRAHGHSHPYHWGAFAYSGV